MTKIGMDIKIGAPYIIGHNLSTKETKEVARVLGNSMPFKLALIDIRKKYKIPDVGFNYKNKSELEAARRLNDNPDFIDDVFDLTQVFTPPLPRYWAFSLLYFVLENILRPPQAPEILTYPSKYFKYHNKENPLGLFLLLNYFFILIGENVSKKQLHDYIDEEWPEIRGYIAKLPKNPVNQMLNWELGEKIVYMKDVEDKTFPEIVNELSRNTKSVEEYDKLNAENVKTIYHRTKKKLADYWKM